jgi:hypothetical protein
MAGAPLALHAAAHAKQQAGHQRRGVQAVQPLALTGGQGGGQRWVAGAQALGQPGEQLLQPLAQRVLGHDALEFCWVRLRPSRMGKGIEAMMLKNAIDAIASTAEGNAFAPLKDKRIFSVWRTDDENMNKVMVECGFVKHDRDHAALVGEEKRVQLWLYPVPNS